MQFLTPTVLQFIGGAAAVLLGSLVLKQGTDGALVMGGVIAMANALKSPGHVMEDRKRAEEQRRSTMPPPESFDAAPREPKTVPDQPAAKRGKS